MRLSLYGAVLLSALVFLTWAVPARTQIPFDVTVLMQDINKGITTMAQEMLTDKRVLELENQGLIVAPLQANIPDADEEDDFIGFINIWAQEKMLTAMIREDEDAHFAVLDRAMLEMILKDPKVNLAPDSLHNPQFWPVIGKAANAQYILTGSYSVVPMNERPLQLAISVTTRIVNLETGRGIAASTFDIIFKQPEPDFRMEQ